MKLYEPRPQPPLPVCDCGHLEHDHVWTWRQLFSHHPGFCSLCLCPAYEPEKPGSQDLASRRLAKDPENLYPDHLVDLFLSKEANRSHARGPIRAPLSYEHTPDPAPSPVPQKDSE